MLHQLGIFGHDKRPLFYFPAGKMYKEATKCCSDNWAHVKLKCHRQMYVRAGAAVFLSIPRPCNCIQAEHLTLHFFLTWKVTPFSCCCSRNTWPSSSCVSLNNYTHVFYYILACYSVWLSQGIIMKCCNYGNTKRGCASKLRVQFFWWAWEKLCKVMALTLKKEL